MTYRCAPRKRFASQAGAYAAAKRMAGAGEQRYPSACRHCGGWHLLRSGDRL